jgi:hypothetical protein
MTEQHRALRERLARRVLCGTAKILFASMLRGCPTVYFATRAAWSMRRRQKSPELAVNLLRERLRSASPAKTEGIGGEMAA